MRAEAEGLGVVARGLGRVHDPMSRRWVVVQSLMLAPHLSPKTNAMPPSNPPWAMPACSTMPALASTSPTTGPMIRAWGVG